MADFPKVVKNPLNRIDTTSQYTSDIEGYVFDGADGSQVALWRASADRTSSEHQHDFDEYVVVLEGRATLTTPSGTLELTKGAEHVVERGTPQSMAVTAGTRTLHVFGGRRARRAVSTQPEDDSIEAHLIDLERRALVRWCNGDPGGFLEICAPDVVYFDPFLDRRIDGLSALTEYYAGIRGKVRAARFEILNPRVQRVGDLAILTFNFVSYGGNEDGLRWNCTEGYRRDASDWRIVQTHWSFTNRRP